MKNKKWLFNFVFGIIALVVFPLTLVQATQDEERINPNPEHKINICHEADGVWNAQNIDENGWDNGHSGHLNDYKPYLGPLGDNDKPTSDGDNWCRDNQPNDVCLNIADMQTTVPVGMEVDGNKQCTTTPIDVCPNIGGVQTSLDSCPPSVPEQCDVVSDETNIVEDGSAAVEAWNHPSWFDENTLGSAAKWIWSTFKITNPSVDEPKVFVKKFNLDTIPSSASIEVAADNGFILEVNGIEVVNEITNEFNYGATKSYTISNLVIGENTIRMTVKNFAYNTEDPELNPAGALYKLHIINSSCSDIPDICPNINGYQTKAPKGYEVDDNGDCVKSLVCDPNVNLIQNGDFENPILPFNSMSFVKDITVKPNSILKWLVSWVVPQTTGTLGLEIQNHIAGDPYSGSQHAELDGDHPVTIWQDIPTIPGTTYKLDFAYSPRQGRTAADNEITVRIDGGILGGILSAVGLSSGTNWTSESRTFVATGNTTKVEFTDTGTDTSFGGYLDNVGLYCQTEEDHLYVTTNPATSITSNSTVVNGTNGDIVATNEAFWWGTTPGGPFVPAPLDASAQYPSGWVGAFATTQDLSVGGAFSLPLGSLNPNTSYYFVAWSFVDGVWYPGDVLTFTTLPVVNNDYICSDGLDNDGDGFIDGQDPGCDSETDNDETNASSELCTDDSANNFGSLLPCIYDTGTTDLCPNIEGTQEVLPSGKILRNGSCVSRQRSGSISTLTEGRVLGASTSCGIYLNKYIKLGDKNNDKNEVIKLQEFLNEYLGLNLVVDGFYGLKTYNAVKAFQLKHQSEVLSPWVGVGKLKKENDPTGYVYKTTQRWINMIKCPELNLPMPELL